MSDLSIHDPRRAFVTACPLSEDGAHAWERDAAKSTRTCNRYGCPCGARGWQQIERGKPPGPINEYQRGSAADKGRPPPPPKRAAWTVRPKLTVPPLARGMRVKGPKDKP